MLPIGETIGERAGNDVRRDGNVVVADLHRLIRCDRDPAGLAVALLCSLASYAE